MARFSMAWRWNLSLLLTAALFSTVVLLGGLITAPEAFAGPFTAECEQRLEEEDELEGGKENPEWTAYLSQCEEEAKEHSEHPTKFDPGPNLSAFTAGVELSVFIALFTISSLLVLNWIVKTMRSSV